MGSGAGPGRALGSRRVFRRRSVAATSAAAAAAASSSPPLPLRRSARAARGTPGNAAGDVAESCLAGAVWVSECFSFPLPLHCPKRRRVQSQGLKTEWGGRGQFIPSYPFHKNINLGVLGGTVRAHEDDVTASEITGKGARPLGAGAGNAPARWQAR